MRLTNYWWLLIWPFIIGALSLVFNMERNELVDGQRQNRWRLVPAFGLAVPFVIWAGWRQLFGDTEMYRRTFLNLPSEFGQIAPYMKTVQKGHGFRLLEMLFKCYISNSDIAFFTFVAVIQISCLVYIYRKYSPNFWLSIFLFVASTDYLSWMHNGIRQFIAVAIIFLCVPLIAKRRYILAVIIVLLSSQIHGTALIFLPFIFVVNGEFRNRRTLLFLVGIVLAVVFVDRVTGFLISAMEDTAYEGDIAFLKTDNGTNIFRVLFYSVPAVMSWVYRSTIDNANDPLINVCANLSIVTMGFYIFSFFTSGILMGSIPIYFGLSNYILIPWLMENVYDRVSAKLLETVFVVVYTIFFYYQCGPAWGLL